MNKIKFLLLMVAFNVFADNNVSEVVGGNQFQNELVITQDKSQLRIHQYFKSEKTADFISIVSSVNKSTMTGQPSIELIITTQSGQFIFSHGQGVLLGDHRYDELKLGESTSLTKSEVFFSDLVFEELLSLNESQKQLKEFQEYDKYFTMIESFGIKSYNTQACRNLANAISSAFAELDRLREMGSPNVKAFYNIVIVPMLYEFATQCIGEV